MSRRKLCKIFDTNRYELRANKKECEPEIGNRFVAIIDKTNKKSRAKRSLHRFPLNNCSLPTSLLLFLTNLHEVFIIAFCLITLPSNSSSSSSFDQFLTSLLAKFSKFPNSKIKKQFISIKGVCFQNRFCVFPQF